MGHNTQNWNFAADIQANGVGPEFKGWTYSWGVQSPPSHGFCPHRVLDDDTVDAIVAAAKLPEAVWLDAHPAPMRAWLEGLPALHRACCQEAARRGRR